jgi:PEP-CTERM motif
MIRIRIMALAVAATAVLAFGSGVRADIIFDTIHDSTNPTTILPSNGSADVPVFGNYLGASFTTGAGQSELTDLQLVLSLDSTESPVSGGSSTILLVHGTVTGGPVFSLGITYVSTVADTSLTTTPTPVDFAPPYISSPILLAANSTYWVVLASYGTQAAWSYTTSTNTVGAANEAYFYNGAIPNYPTGPFQMEIGTTSVPEPSSLVLGAIGIVVLAVARRRLARP